MLVASYFSVYSEESASQIQIFNSSRSAYTNELDMRVYKAYSCYERA